MTSTRLVKTRAKRNIVTACLTAALLAISTGLPLDGQAAIESHPIQFAKGTSSATIKATLKGDQTVDYKLRAKAGQTMQVSMKTSNASSYFNVLPPGSKGEAIFIGSRDGNDWTGALPKDGEYTVRVYLMRNAARRNEVANYTLTVGIATAATGAPAVSGPAPSDAKVGGTFFHATGKISCAMGKEAPRMCAFGVIRSKPGHAQVQITLPVDMKRTLTFAGNQVTADSSASRPATVKSSKQGDEWTVEVNDFETFRIPEAVINGG